MPSALSIPLGQWSSQTFDSSARGCQSLLMTEKTLRALSLVAGYSAVMEDDYSSACSTADLCDLGRETMDWIIENSNRQADLECDSASTIQHIKHEIKQEEGEEDEPERVLLELGIIDRPGDYFETQVGEI